MAAKKKASKKTAKKAPAKAAPKGAAKVKAPAASAFATQKPQGLVRLLEDDGSVVKGKDPGLSKETLLYLYEQKKTHFQASQLFSPSYLSCQ